LDLAEYPFAKPGWQLAYSMLKNAGFTLDWIELDKSIRAELLQCRKLLEDQLAWACEALISSESKRQVEAELNHRYHWTIATFTKRAEQLNERIELFNLKVPLTSLQRHKIQVAEEIDRFLVDWRNRTEIHTHRSASSSFAALDTQAVT
jgi:hypothetical protein